MRSGGSCCRRSGPSHSACGRVRLPRVPAASSGIHGGLGVMLSGMRRFALITLLVFGCATVRTPVAPLGEPTDAPGTVAPPGLELWLESPDPVPAAQREQAERQARAALDTAIQNHEVPRTAMGASDAVLFVRERAVGVTEERRSQQNW